MEWYQKSWFKYMVVATLALVIIWFYGHVQFFIQPLQTFLMTMLIPIILAGILYYLLRPVVRFLSKYIWQTAAILIVFVALLGGLFLIGAAVGEFLINQFQELVKQWPVILDAGSRQVNDILQMIDFESDIVQEMRDNTLDFLKSSVGTIGNNVIGIAGAVTNAVTVTVVIPFILFYLLKDDGQLLPSMLKWSPASFQTHVKETLKEMDQTIAAYVLGQMLVACVIGLFMFIGYLIIGLPFAAVLALFALVTSFIPFLGPFLGILPAIVIAIPEGTFMLVKVLIVFVIVQQAEGNLVSPQIMGNRLNVHPVTVILVILATGSVFGFIGILIAVPVYAVIKVIVLSTVKWVRAARADDLKE
ncbi:AI-2E family transporter [Bacillaceae bacterium SIJ1]|uniref:AI-2E family transporter n=1 Tax=Litoribacterium kuwaitense TaxID=1398745 RepID=UPI0013E9F8A2|nr:AI-2E family transporter [Litoribacterium kuwaitense]NGP44245.1 AI-2E family transporter [Litoribacterium kuwaitense]